MRGQLTYWARQGRSTLKSLKLSVCTERDMEVICSSGLAESRRNRIVRLIEEARGQGVRLTYKDLSLILVTSKATLKRDMREIRRRDGNMTRSAGEGTDIP